MPDGLSNLVLALVSGGLKCVALGVEQCLTVEQVLRAGAVLCSTLVLLFLAVWANPIEALAEYCVAYLLGLAATGFGISYTYTLKFQSHTKL